MKDFDIKKALMYLIRDARADASKDDLYEHSQAIIKAFEALKSDNKTIKSSTLEMIAVEIIQDLDSIARAADNKKNWCKLLDEMIIEQRPTLLLK